MHQSLMGHLLHLLKMMQQATFEVWTTRLMFTGCTPKFWEGTLKVVRYSLCKCSHKAQLTLNSSPLVTWSLADDSTENGIAWPGWNRLGVQARMEGKWRKHSPWACGPWLAFIAADVAWPGVTSPKAGEAINAASETWGGLTNTSWTNSKANYPPRVGVYCNYLMPNPRIARA